MALTKTESILGNFSVLSAALHCCAAAVCFFSHSRTTPKAITFHSIQLSIRLLIWAIKYQTFFMHSYNYYYRCHIWSAHMSI